MRSLPAAHRPAARNVPEPESAGRRAGGAALVRQPGWAHVAARHSRLLRRVRYAAPVGLQGRRPRRPRRQGSSPCRSRPSCRSRRTAGTTCGLPTTRATTSRRSWSTRRSRKSSTCPSGFPSSACCPTSRSTAPSESRSTRRRSRSSSRTRRRARAASRARWRKTARRPACGSIRSSPTAARARSRLPTTCPPAPRPMPTCRFPSRSGFTTAMGRSPIGPAGA